MYFIFDILPIIGISVPKVVGSKILERSVNVFGVNDTADSFNPLEVELILKLFTEFLHPLADSYRVSDS